MKILLLGASGRVGRHMMRQSQGNGSLVHALVRKPIANGNFPDGVTFIPGNIFEPGILKKIFAEEKYDAVVNVLGGGLEKSTVVTDSTRLVVESTSSLAPMRYVGISVLTLMPKNVPGSITAFILSSTFLKHVDRDHYGALESLRSSNLDWAMVACGRITDGEGGASITQSERFTGGYRQIQTGDVAREIWRELVDPKHHMIAFGAWA